MGREVCVCAGAVGLTIGISVFEADAPVMRGGQRVKCCVVVVMGRKERKGEEKVWSG